MGIGAAAWREAKQYYVGSMAVNYAVINKNAGDSGMCSGCKAKAKTKHQASDLASKPQVTHEVKQHAVDEADGKLTGDTARPGLRTMGHVISISDDFKAHIQKR